MSLARLTRKHSPWPITLLNVAYKIIAKALALRLQPLLPSLIRTGQTGFIKGRYILDNILLAHEAAYIAIGLGQALALWLLDFEKAFDKVDWAFLLKVLAKVGIPPGFCTWVQILLHQSNSRVVINRCLSKPFGLHRSVRQGCPLAPFLFLFVADSLGYLLDQNMAVHGLSIRNPAAQLSLQVKDSMFADDIILLLDATPSTFKAAEETLGRFCSNTDPSSSVSPEFDKSDINWKHVKTTTKTKLFYR